MSSRFLEGVRMIAPVAVAAFLFAFSFGVLARGRIGAHRSQWGTPGLGSLGRRGKGYSPHPRVGDGT